MELRQLTTERERRIFAERMEEARAEQGAHFRETGRSKVGKIHLEYGLPYGLFEHDDDLPEQMMSGLVMHDLASFPQTYPQPDLTHLPPRSVIEGGELWSFARGAGLLAQHGAIILAGLMQVQALLVYPTLKPCDQSGAYVRSNFAKTGDPFVWPYCETTDGGQIWVQPMVLEVRRWRSWCMMCSRVASRPAIRCGGFGLTIHSRSNRRCPVIQFQSGSIWAQLNRRLPTVTR